MNKQSDWRSIFSGITMGLAVVVIGGAFLYRNKQRSAHARSNRIRDFLVRAGLISKPRHAHIGPLPVPGVVEEIPEVFLRAFR